jgi:very-short-patch-repair endonuclease
MIGGEYLPVAGSHEVPARIVKPLSSRAQRKADKKTRRAARKAARRSLSPQKPKPFIPGSSSKGAIAFAAKMRANPTPAEKALQFFAKSLGYYVDSQAVYGDQRIGHRIVDVLITHKGHEIALEADGAQHYSPEGIEADRIRAEYFARYFPRVKFLRYSNHEILREGFIDRLKDDLAVAVSAVASVPPLS